jgi:hypothetical protein
VHVPDETTGSVVPLRSEEEMRELRKEYKTVAKGWNSTEEVPEEAVGH